MKKVRILPSKLKGEVIIPPSKSIAHRAVISAGLAAGKSLISNLDFSEDLTATAEGMAALGAELEKKGDSLTIDGTGFGRKANHNYSPVIDCNESGTTLRLLLPLALVREGSALFKGRGNLGKRPLAPYYEIFRTQGIEYSSEPGRLELRVKGSLKPGEFRIQGDLSSQFISGLLFALPLLAEDSRVVITTELESKGYVDLTLDMLGKFGVKIENKAYREFWISGGQEYRAQDITVEGDYSQAAFYLVAGALGSDVKCRGLNFNSLQGDKVILELIEKMGGRILRTGEYLKAENNSLNGTTIDGAQFPDLIPILAVLAALSPGKTEIVNAGRLRIKESDRLKAICEGLSRLGAEISELEAGLVIQGKEYLTGGIADSWNDHRIAMALAIASTRCKEPVIITNSDAVKKSYPGFWADFKSLGGKIDEWSMG